MKSLNLSGALLVLVLALPCTGQESGGYDHLAKHYTLQAGITDNFKLSAFEGSSLSIKYSMSGNKALRLGVNIGYAYQE